MDACVCAKPGAKLNNALIGWGGELMNESLKQAAEKGLIDAGVPVNLAAQCAEIVAKDDPSKPNLGRTVSDQHLINSSMTWMLAKRDEVQAKEFLDK
jgi:hypothetical protein